MDADLARALPVALDFDLERPGESLRNCVRYMQVGFLLEISEENPLGWRYGVDAGVERLRGASRVVDRLGELPDPKFTTGLLIPTYLDAVAADRPITHRVAAVGNGTFLAYRKLTIPIRAAIRSARPSHILTLVRLDLAIPLARRPKDASPLTSRERECLSLAASGLLTKQIAAEIGVSDKTVELHLAQARRKLGARTTAHAIAMSMATAMIG